MGTYEGRDGSCDWFSRVAHSVTKLLLLLLLLLLLFNLINLNPDSLLEQVCSARQLQRLSSALITIISGVQERRFASGRSRSVTGFLIVQMEVTRALIAV